MAYYNAPGQFDPNFTNPQWGGENLPYGSPLGTGPGPFGGTYISGRGWLQNEGGVGPQQNQQTFNFGSFLNNLMGSLSKWQTSGAGAVPAAWSGGDSSATTSEVNPMDVIKAAKPKIMEEMNRNMASVAQRLGGAGVPLTSGSYATVLGQQGRKASDDLGSLYMNTLSSAAENQANREQQAKQDALNRSLQAWQQEGGWQFQAGQNQLQQQQQWMPMLTNLIQSLMSSGQVPDIQNWRW